MSRMVRPALAFDAPAGFAFVAPIEGHGSGSTFVVERAGARFVCKRLSERARDDADALRGMEDEARILEALDGRGAPRVVASGGDAHGPFVVMEAIPMPTLGARARDSRSMDQAAMAAFEALAHVHDASDAHGALAVVHGDVSPANVLVAIDGGVAKLVDFGLARWRGSIERRAGLARGTLAFVAPEVARAESFDTRADLFAVSASLLAVASGSAPRPSIVEPALIVLAGETPIVEWATHAATAFSPTVADVLIACVSHAADARPATARDALARAMRPA